jgi:hypothetical protein
MGASIRFRIGAHGGRHAPIIARQISVVDARLPQMRVWVMFADVWKTKNRTRREIEASTTLSDKCVSIQMHDRTKQVRTCPREGRW